MDIETKNRLDLLNKQKKELKLQLEFEISQEKIREIEEDLYEVEDTINKIQNSFTLQQLRTY